MFRRILRTLARSSSLSSSLPVPNALVVPTKTSVLHPLLPLQVSGIVSQFHKVLGHRRLLRHPQRLANPTRSVTVRQRACLVQQIHALRMILRRARMVERKRRITGKRKSARTGRKGRVVRRVTRKTQSRPTRGLRAMLRPQMAITASGHVSVTSRYCCTL